MSARSATGLLSLPTSLIHSVIVMLSDKEALQLILSNCFLRQEVQTYFSLALRPEVAKSVASPIASARNTVNLRPSVVGMGKDGELTYQQCLSIKASAISETQYRTLVIEMFEKRLSESRGIEQLRDVTIGTALGLGGTLMSESNRNALLASILSTYLVSNPAHMAPMLSGLCSAFGRRGRWADFKAVLDQILTAHPGIRSEHRLAMLYNFFIAMGGEKISAENRDSLIGQIFDAMDKNWRLPLNLLMQGMFRGLGGKQMSSSTRDAVLTRMMVSAGTWGPREMGAGVACLCEELGGAQMTAINRDGMLSKILASSATSSPDQMGAMIGSLCFSLGGSTSPFARKITEENLQAVIDAILHSRTTSSPQQLCLMLHKLFRVLGSGGMLPAHLHLLEVRIQESGHVEEIISALELTQGGLELLGLLDLV